MGDEYSKDDLLGQLWDEVNRLRNRTCKTCRWWDRWDFDPSEIFGPGAEVRGECSLHNPYRETGSRIDPGSLDSTLETYPDFGCNQHELKESDGRKEAENG